MLIHVDVNYSWGLLGWKHMHKDTGGVLGVIMHRSVSLPVRPCTNEQTVVLLLSCCPILAPSTSPACLLASPSSSQGGAGRWILMELHYLGNFCEMDAVLLYAIISGEGSGKKSKTIPVWMGIIPLFSTCLSHLPHNHYCLLTWL